MSSLQLAAQSGKKGKQESASPGSFETSFAGGLDFSEFSAGRGDGNRRSAAADLLQVRQREQCQQNALRREELRLQQSIRRKIDSSKQLKKNDQTLRAPPPSTNDGRDDAMLPATGLMGALYNMHSTDTSEQRLISKRRFVTKLGLKKSGQMSGKNRVVVKKKGRKKY